MAINQTISATTPNNVLTNVYTIIGLYAALL